VNKSGRSSIKKMKSGRIQISRDLSSLLLRLAHKKKVATRVCNDKLLPAICPFIRCHHVAKERAFPIIFWVTGSAFVKLDKFVFSSFLTKKLTYYLLSAEPHLGASASATKADSLCHGYNEPAAIIAANDSPRSSCQRISC
jgi:hypothetical protein